MTGMLPSIPDLPPELRRAAAMVLAESDPARKCRMAAALRVESSGKARLITPAWIGVAPDQPGRPVRPQLVHPARVPKRGLGTPAGRAALLHALCHIEFNAVNLALDAIVRFAGLPETFYLDWLQVAEEEARHFTLLIMRLADLGHRYGDFAAHDGLWEAAYKTRHDVLARMALVPRVLEARGLDVTPGLQARLERVGDPESAAILDVLLRDEIGHVAIGNRWFTRFCADRGLAPEDTFRALCVEHGVKWPQPPFNLDARRRAGFDEQALDRLIAGTGS